MHRRNRTSVGTALEYAVLALIAALPVAAWAQDAAQALRLSGFGTLGMSSFSAKDVDFAPFPQAYGPGFTRRIDPGLDSNLAIQADATLHKRVGASLQLMSHRTADRGWTPEAMRANIRVALNDNLTLRLGHVGVPVYLISDSLRVNFSNIWVRPPQEVYGLTPFDHSDGADIAGRWDLSGTTLNIKAAMTRSRALAPNSNRPETDVVRSRGVTLTAQLERGPLTLHAGYQGGTFLSYTPTAAVPLFNALSAAGAMVPGSADLSARLNPTGKTASLIGVGARYEAGTWLLQAEFVRRQTESLVADQTGWYLTGGKRFGKWTGYATAAARKRDDQHVVNTLPRGLSPAIDGLSAGVDRLLASSKADQWSSSLGISYELSRSALLKVQRDWIRLSPESVGGPFMNHQPSFQPRSYRLLSVNVDFVF